ncbi:glycosyltransferase family 2 protein [uncultured Paludibaculum sp.]|uniref:glycosyltransferase family 2 protein n=1 Tax=uncultured Paludibaculum sp. TaxID=1765020 RepID=UPI002AAB350A|nr:glycosyltransferase family 2 protein [uncultured Paludibaculum sp.]
MSTSRPAPNDDLSAGLSVFFPAYNDQPSIAGLVQAAYDTLAPLTSAFEIIVVNDGSRDGTLEALAPLEQALGERLRVVTHPVNRGYGAALRSGFAAARYPWVFYTDGDGQYDVRELADLLGHADETVGLVNGYKRRRQDPAHRIWIGKFYNAVVRRLFGIRLRDIDCDFRLIRRHIVAPDRLRADGGTICIEIAMLAEASGLSTVVVPVSHYPRLHGRSQFFRIRPLLNTFRELVRLHVVRVGLPLLARLATPLPALFKSSRAVEGD